MQRRQCRSGSTLCSTFCAWRIGIPATLLLFCLALAGCGGGAGGSDGDTDPDGDTASPLPACEMPTAPVLGIIHRGATLQFFSSGDGVIETGIGSDPGLPEPEAWRDQATLTFEQDGAATVYARLRSRACDPRLFKATYLVQERYPPPAGQEGSDAVARDDPAIIGWADSIAAVEYGEGLDPQWQFPEAALGPAEGTPTDIVSLGRGGTITLRFDPPIGNGQGPDFAVFENGFSDTFLELAHVEVSSDGRTFVRFDSATLQQEAVGPFGAVDPTLVTGLAGRYRMGFATPFDLQLLAFRDEALTGRVDLESISHVRIVDLVGDGSELDSFGRPIYDPYPTAGSAGFDLDAVGVLHR